MFKYVFPHYYAVADLADSGYIHNNQQADTAAFDLFSCKSVFTPFN